MLQNHLSIDNLFQEIKIRIDKVVDIVQYFNCHIKVTNVFRENGLLLHEIQNEWHSFQQCKLGDKIEKILNDVEETDKNVEWYSIVEKIQERFRERFKGCQVENHHKFNKQTSCIIFHKVPNHLNEYNLSKEETIRKPCQLYLNDCSLKIKQIKDPRKLNYYYIIAHIFHFLN